MQNLVETITPEIVGQELRKANVLPTRRGLYLELVPGNLERRDSQERVQMRIHARDRPLYSLTVGRDLSDLWKRTQAFTAACPAITCQPAFRHQTRDLEYIGLEYFDGTNLESAVLGGQCSPSDALAASGRVLAALEQTFRPSRIESVTQELDRLLARALASPMFGGLDQRFLKDIIFPFVRAGALHHPCRSRWSNGDFVPRNVLVDGRGQVRLIDYEFAHRTHFSADDWWRWRTFNPLPPEGRELPNPSGQQVDAGWMEALFILRQMILSHETNGAQLAVSDARHWTERLLALAAQAHNHFRSSLFLHPLAQAPTPAPSLSAPSAALLPGSLVRSIFSAQLFWKGDQDAGFAESRSQFQDCSVDKPTLLRFTLRDLSAGQLQLRLDPVDAVGLIRISSIRVTALGNPQALFNAPEVTGWNQVSVCDGLMPLPDDRALALLSLTDDPNLNLPAIQIDQAGGSLTCEVSLIFTPHLTDLPELLNRQTSSARSAVEGIRGQLQQSTVELATLSARLTETQDSLRNETLARNEVEGQLTATRGLLQQAAAQADARTTEIAALSADLAETQGSLRNETQSRSEVEVVLAEHKEALRLATMENKQAQLLYGWALESLYAQKAALDNYATRALLTRQEFEQMEEQLSVIGLKVQDLQSQLELNESDRSRREKVHATVLEQLAESTLQIQSERELVARLTEAKTALAVRLTEAETELAALRCRPLVKLDARWRGLKGQEPLPPASSDK